ncbi:hypothetical protein B7H23_12915 [Notoacmeibacter marinus]|uniref:Uncharacterized protein n=1 Tax=Notoacmeibacter marinus TaxID=1876515 RepID=A0A231UTF1_9HYPH|nr:hypothetical protein [Notoacmeibacter marinus]OXS99100.1 hypothetical protein B7H23_12915 [Notoacmeibacter marinus]
MQSDNSNSNLFLLADGTMVIVVDGETASCDMDADGMRRLAGALAFGADFIERGEKIPGLPDIPKIGGAGDG